MCLTVQYNISFKVRSHRTTFSGQDREVTSQESDHKPEVYCMSFCEGSLVEMIKSLFHCTVVITRSPQFWGHNIKLCAPFWSLSSLLFWAFASFSPFWFEKLFVFEWWHFYHWKQMDLFLLPPTKFKISTIIMYFRSSRDLTTFYHRCIWYNHGYLSLGFGSVDW